ncbi:MAG TPA: hypothetical protein VET26_04590, partial [Candidatus Sulfotelmatobacter sp.]|nr:hypothetical protein [Candidatus Sulfotelmatobacter sp.]
KVAYVPSVAVTHLHARTAARNFAAARFDFEYGALLFSRKYGPRWWYWARRLALLWRAFYLSRLCTDERLSRQFWGNSAALLRRVYGELLRVSLPTAGRLASSSAPPAGIDWTVS